MIKKKTYFAGADNEIKWYIVDANGKTLGRLATQVAMVLRGKHQPTYTPHVDMGNRVVVINAEKVVVTGKKYEQKRYYRHSGYPGGLREKTFKEMIQHKPEQIIHHAVRGMLPQNRLGRKLRGKLKVYSGPEHPHQAQKPQPLN
ncbi:MAG: 50S ribosomal protein L13 [Candidatus Poribacteria bacterium]